MTQMFDIAEREVLYRVIASRRDMRHFLAGSTVAADVLRRILQAAHQGPSVGLMQPWRFIRIVNPLLRHRVGALVEVGRQATAEVLGERSAEFLRMKVEGVRECAELLVAMQSS